jgi:hypothetical protein
VGRAHHASLGFPPYWSKAQTSRTLFVVVPRYTEQRIRDLCAQALASTNDADRNRVLEELRAALRERTQLAKESLACQITAIDWYKQEAQDEKTGWVFGYYLLRS